MRTRSAWIVAAFVALTAAFPAGAQDSATLKKIKDRKSIVLGVREAADPFSYVDAKGQYIGYSIDLCGKIVDAVKAALKMPDLAVTMTKVTPQVRMQILMSGDVDMECGSTTNSVQRQEQVSFGPTYFVINVTAAVKKSSSVNSIADLNGKTVSTTSGTTSVPLIKSYEKSKNVDVKEIYGKDHAESFLLLADDRAAAFIMDDILLAGQIANARNPADYRILPESLRQEPYSMMLRKGDAPFKALVDRAVGAVMKSGEIEKIFAKWFNAPIPPKGVNLNFPITPAIRDAFKNPNDKGV